MSRTLEEVKWQRLSPTSTEKDKFLIFSAGNKPAEKVNPVVVEALREKGIDISANKPKLLTFQMAQDSDLIVTMGCNDQGICPGPFETNNRLET